MYTYHSYRDVGKNAGWIPWVGVYNTRLQRSLIFWARAIASGTFRGHVLTQVLAISDAQAAPGEL